MPLFYLRTQINKYRGFFCWNLTFFFMHIFSIYPKKVLPNRFSCLDVYWIQTYKQTVKPNLWIKSKYLDWFRWSSNGETACRIYKTKGTSILNLKERFLKCFVVTTSVDTFIIFFVNFAIFHCLTIFKRPWTYDETARSGWITSVWFSYFLLIIKSGPLCSRGKIVVMLVKLGGFNWTEEEEERGERKGTGKKVC